MRKHILIIAFVMVIGLAAANTGTAQTLEESTFSVSADVVASCRITSVTAIDFGNYDPTDSVNVEADGSISYQCVQGTQFDTYITGTRAMGNGLGDTLDFELYSDSGRTTSFPSANPGAPVTAADNNEHTTQVYGRINPGLDVPAGVYAVDLIATIEY